MDPQLTAYITLVCTSGVLNVYLGIYVLIRRHRYKNIAKLFILSTLATTIYCFGYAFSLTSTTLEQIKFWNIIQYIGMPFSPPLGLLVVMRYLGIRVTRRGIAALLTIPCISLLLDATNDWHYLHYRSYEIDPLLGAPYTDIQVGVWFVVHGVFLFCCMLTGLVLVLSRWRETARNYRSYLTALIAAQVIPMVTAFLYLLGVTPDGIDPVPMVVWISSAMLLWSINSSRMFHITPVAKEAIFNSIHDGVIVLDESKRLIECNQAGKSMFKEWDQSLLGRRIDVVWRELTGESFPFDLEAAAGDQELTVTLNGQACIYQVRTSPLQHAHHNSTGTLLIFTDITALKELQMKLEQHAYYDELTQIYNRRAFFLYCKRYYEDARSTASPFTIMLFDIDYFKRVNDTYGHHIGDLLLTHIVGIVQASLPEGTLFARYGGEEFIVALRGDAAQTGELLANQVREHIAAQPLIVADATISATSSFGIAEAGGHEEETLYQLLHRADEALYAAKREGRNCVCVSP